MGTIVILALIAAAIYLIIKKQGYFVFFKRYITLHAYHPGTANHNKEIIFFINKISLIEKREEYSIVVVGSMEFLVVEPTKDILYLINKSFLA